MSYKINVVFVAPPEGLGGGNRKYNIYFKYLSDKLFNKYYVVLSEKTSTGKLVKDKLFLSEYNLKEFLLSNNIHFVYLANKVSKDTLEFIEKNCFIIKNINFTEVYDSNNSNLNLIISKTDYWKLKWIHKSLVNSYVVYNPIDFDKWVLFDKAPLTKFELGFEKKLIVGRLARAEPSKWHYLIIETLLKLDKQKNYDFGFVFAGMPYLYKKFLQVFLSKKMLSSVYFLPELKNDEDLARFYKSIDVFWQTSWVGESFGNVIAESFCFKKPVITDFKHFYKKGIVNKNRYDAQAELVDHGINGFYCNNPLTFIKTISDLSRKEVNKLGINGFNKCKFNYDAKLAGNTMASILYSFLIKKKKFNKQKSFENLKMVPNLAEVKSFEKEYIKRMSVAEASNGVNRGFLFRKKLWRMIEYIYLSKRFILKKAGYDLEKKKGCAV